mgnify:CR=1 FL=1
MSRHPDADVFDAHVHTSSRSITLSVCGSVPTTKTCRADLAKAALAIERLRALVALPDAQPQLARAARPRCLLDSLP